MRLGNSVKFLCTRRLHWHITHTFNHYYPLGSLPAHHSYGCLLYTSLSIEKIGFSIVVNFHIIAYTKHSFKNLHKMDGGTEMPF